MSKLTSTQTRSLRVVPAALARVRALETRLAQVKEHAAPVVEVAPVAQVAPSAQPVEVHLLPVWEAFSIFSGAVVAGGVETSVQARSREELETRAVALVRGAAPTSVLFVLHTEEAGEVAGLRALAASIARALSLVAGEAEPQTIGEWATGCFVVRAASVQVVASPEVQAFALSPREVVARHAASVGAGCIWRLYEARDALRALIERLSRPEACKCGALCALADVEWALWELDPFEDFLSGEPDYDEFDADELLDLERGA